MVLELSLKEYKLISYAILEQLPNYYGYPHRKAGILPRLHFRKGKHPNIRGEFVEYIINEKNRYKKDIPRIILYYNNTDSYFELIRTISHEYIHYITLYNIKLNEDYDRQNDIKGYDGNKYEKIAYKQENKYSRLIWKKIKTRLAL